jgi:hypothetical protein
VFESLLAPGNAWTRTVSAFGDACIPADLPVGLDTWGDPDDWSIPVYTAQASARLVPLYYSPQAWSRVASGEWRRSGNTTKVEDQILQSCKERFPFPGNVFSSTSVNAWKLPDQYNEVQNPQVGPRMVLANTTHLPAPGPDGHMCIKQSYTVALETYGTIVLSGGAIVALSYSMVQLTRDGDGFENGQTASMLPCYLGLLKDGEVTSGRINHALAITVPARLLQPAIVAPAYAFDRNAMTETPPYSGGLPMGSRVALPRSFLFANLRTEEGKVIARAAMERGFIVVDRGGQGITIRTLRNETKAKQRPALRKWNQALQDDLQSIFARVVRA